ncbi:MAG: hypothetical protein K1000chlam2_00033 [Chlamydiae bacterium]|nr:hypothetical protein [Chlamydiota bacterium]
MKNLKVGKNDVKKISRLAALATILVLTSCSAMVKGEAEVEVISPREMIPVGK